MSFLYRPKPFLGADPNLYTPKKWLCDHCCEVYPVTVKPKHTRPKSAHHTPMASRPEAVPPDVNLPDWWYPTHYCSDECVQPYDAAAVEEALKKGPVWAPWPEIRCFGTKEVGPPEDKYECPGCPDCRGARRF